MKKKKIFVIVLTLILLGILAISIYIYNENRKEQIRLDKIKKEEELVKEITSHYNEFVKTSNDAILYNDNNEEVGKIASGIELSLDEIKIDKDTRYFKVKDFENIYIKYDDVEKIESLSIIDSRYKNYILYNEDIVTKEVTNFYTEDDSLIYTFNRSFDLPIIVKETNKYGIEYNGRLLYVKNEDVLNIKENINSNAEKANSIRVIAYHAFYDKNVKEESWCRTSICHSTEQIESHAKYISDNNYFTLNMKELEMFIDGKINLPRKSLVITIDDGLLAERGIEILNNFKLNATVFLVTSYYKPENFIQYEYIEFHSHGHNIHNVGQCPGGQGGGVKCLEKTALQLDLKTSRDILNGSTVFCYPFYEYNNYAIDNLKEAGFTMAFAGLIGNGKATVGINKYLIPRYTINNTTTVNQLSNIIK